MDVYFVLFVLCIPGIACQNAYKFCVSESDAVSPKCQAIYKGNSQVVCIPVIDSADCAIKLIDKKVDFGVFSAEDALFVLNKIKEKVSVIGELRNKYRLNDMYSFQTVAVVKANQNGGFSGLKSTNYCHPGFGDGQFWTDRVLKEFESTVVPRICSQSNMSNVEIEISSLANFFKTACRPGQWSYDDALDKNLKRRYPSLCALCDSPGRCSYNEDFQGSHKEALTCLTKTDGDVTYVALEHVQEYFGLKPFTQARANASEFKFLCRDGSYRALQNPCTWINQPWPVVLALREKAPALKSLIVNDFLCKRGDCRGKWQEAFTLLLQRDDQEFLPISSRDDDLSNFIMAARKIPNEWDGDACKNKSLRLCTVNVEEYSKCSWLKDAVISEGIEPKLQCVQSYSLWSCFDLIRKDKADIIGIDTDYTFIAHNVFNLSTVMYQDNNYEFYFIILPIVKADSKIRSLKDFQNKRISFPEFDGLAWNSFVSSIKKQALLPKKCPYLNAVAAFLHSACAPGVHDVNHKYFNISVPENMCSLCSKVGNNSNSTGECVANSSNKYYGDFGAMNLLIENKSDIAIIDYRRLFSRENEHRFSQLNKEAYRILCKDGSLKPLINYRQISMDCAMSYGLGAELISRASIQKSDRYDIAELLLRMDDRFGARLSSSDNPIMMYKSFNGSSGSIFNEFTVDLVSIHDVDNYFITNLKDLKSSSLEECHEWKSAASTHSILSKSFFICAFSILYFLLN